MQRIAYNKPYWQSDSGWQPQLNGIIAAGTDVVRVCYGAFPVIGAQCLVSMDRTITIDQSITGQWIVWQRARATTRQLPNEFVSPQTILKLLNILLPL